MMEIEKQFAQATTARISSELARDVIEARDKIIKDALCYYLKIDELYTEELEKIAHRAEFKTYPSGIEIFELDNVPLVEFYPMEAGQLHDGMNVNFNATFRFKELYK